jgi:hypothetical protein
MSDDTSKTLPNKNINDESLSIIEKFNILYRYMEVASEKKNKIVEDFSKILPIDQDASNLDIINKYIDEVIKRDGFDSEFYSSEIKLLNKIVNSSIYIIDSILKDGCGENYLETETEENNDFMIIRNNIIKYIDQIEKFNAAFDYIENRKSEINSS